MKNVNLFETELSLIQNEDLRNIVRAYMDEMVPAYFWEIGASSSGKYHPCFSQGEGGLVRHTKAVCLFATELLRMSGYNYLRQDYKDYIYAACIIHDTCKYGMTNEINNDDFANHAENAALLFDAFYCEKTGNYAPEKLLDAVKAHMGQWSTNYEDRPFTQIDRCVHMADYMASRSFIDIPSITKEYEEKCQTKSEIA